MSSPDYSQAVKDIIDGLGDSPTPDQIYHAVRNYSVDHVVAASAAAAKAGGGGGSQPFTTAETTLTNAQIKALAHPTPVQLVAAPGVGNVLRFSQAFITVDATAGQYTNIAAGAILSISYGGGSDASCFVDESAGGSLSALLGLDGEVTFASLLPASYAIGTTSLEGQVFDASEGENLPLTIGIFNPVNLDLTGGNAANSARVKVWYTVEALA